MQTSINNTMEWFKTVPFSDVVLWDVKRYSFEKIKSQYPIVKLGLHIQEESHKVKLANFPDEEFGILGVSNKIGIFDAYKEKGANINQSYKKMEQGWLAYNPYRVNVGSIGLRTNEHENEYISPAYVVFSCKETLLPDFLFKLFKTDRFNTVINASTTGSVRQNLTIDILKSLDIPLPPIEVQQKILDNYYFESKKSIELAKESNQIGSEINAFLLKELGINLTIKERKSGLSFTQFSTIDRWSVDYLFNLSSIDGLQNAKYPLHPISRYIIESQYGLSSKASPEPVGTPMLRMNNIYNSELDISDLKYISLSKNEKKKYLLEKGDLLFNRTNSKELVGKTAVFKEDEEYTFASYLIRLKLNNLKLDVDYINFLFNSPIGRVQIDLISRQVLGQANVNAQELREFVFPIPDIETQKKIANVALLMKKKQNSLLDQSAEQKINSITNVQNAVLSI
jgi:type I restriction enzyme S subunit